MKQALGLVEISGLSTAVVVADTMAKAANIRILEMENTKGLGYMTIKITGDVGAVKAAVDAGSQIGVMNGKLVSCKVIPRPSDYVETLFCKCGMPEPPTPSGPSTPPEAPTPPEPPTPPEAPAPLQPTEAEEKPVEVEEEETAEPEEKPEEIQAEPEQAETDADADSEQDVKKQKKSTGKTGNSRRK